MDRVKKDRSVFSHSSGMIVLLVLLVVTGILVYKSVDQDWFRLRPSLNLNGEPALIFFNRQRGCQCAMVVYSAAKYQVQDWSNKDRQGVPIFIIDLDVQPDLGKKFRVYRAPTLLLVDESGKTIFAQDEVITDTQPLDLVAFETKIAEVLHGK